jgi:hypothetical protein
MNSIRLVRTAALLVLAVGGIGAAEATVIALPGGLIGPGPITLSAETTAAGTTGAGVNPTLTLPGSYTYANTFTAPTTAFPSGSSYGFYDAYAFTVGGSVANSVTSTINLGSLSVSNLSERLYSANPGDAIPVLGMPPGASYFVAWTSVLPGGSGEVAVLDAMTLAPGTYVLEIRGLVTGASGGSYTGQLNLTPVPLPAALPLLVGGLGALGAFGGRRRRKAA